MYRIVWEYDAEPARLKEFERVYGPAGKWVEFFRRSPDYLGTELFRSTDSGERHESRVMKRSRASYEAFRKANAADYAQLDEWCQSLTRHERTLGMVDDGR